MYMFLLEGKEFCSPKGRRKTHNHLWIPCAKSESVELLEIILDYVDDPREWRIVPLPPQFR